MSRHCSVLTIIYLIIVMCENTHVVLQLVYKLIHPLQVSHQSLHVIHHLVRFL